MAKRRNKVEGYTEFEERGGLSKLKGRAHNPALGLRNKKIHCNISEEGKNKLNGYAEETDLSQSEFLLRLILSEEAKQFVARIKSG